MSAESLDFPFDSPTDFRTSIESQDELVEITCENTVILEYADAQYNHCRTTKPDGGTVFLMPGINTIQSMKASGFAIQKLSSPDERTIEYYNYSYNDFWAETS